MRARKKSDRARSRSRSHSHSHSFLVPGAGLEPAQPLWPQDFKSCVSTVPPSGLTIVLQSYGLAVVRLCSYAVLQFCSWWEYLKSYINKLCPACRTLSRFSGNSTIRANYCLAVVQWYGLAVVQSRMECTNLKNNPQSERRLSQKVSTASFLLILFVPPSESTFKYSILQKIDRLLIHPL